MVDSERGIDAHFVTLLLVGSVGHELENDLFRQLFSKLDLEGSDS
jgi:hypothetical protein